MEICSSEQGVYLHFCSFKLTELSHVVSEMLNIWLIVERAPLQNKQTL